MFDVVLQITQDGFKFISVKLQLFMVLYYIKHEFTEDPLVELLRCWSSPFSLPFVFSVLKIFNTLIPSVPFLQGRHSRPALEFEKSHEKPVGIGSSSSTTPKSPWMPFAALFEAISKEVAPKDMKLVNVHYDLFRVCNFGFLVFRWL